MKYHKQIYEDKQRITSLEKKDSFLFIEVEDTIFYPGGGGQPHDTGVIENNNFQGKEVEVFKKEDKIIHKVKSVKGSLKVGDSVILKIDKEKREKIVRMHTGEHIFYKCLEKEIKGLKLKKIDLDSSESSFFVEALNLTWEDVFKAEKLANELIEKDLPIIKHHYTKEEAIKLGKLRIKPERIKSNNIRVIEVKDFDWSACAGCHSKSTGFIGNILITKFGKAKGGYEIRFKVNVKSELYDLAKTSRIVASFLETDHNNILDKIKKIIDDSENYKNKFRELSAKLLSNFSEEIIKDINFIYALVEEVEKKQLTDKSNELLKEKTIVCLISTNNDRSTVLLNSSKDLKLDAPTLLNTILSNFDGRGGGRDNFAMGSVESKFKDNVIVEFKKELSK